ncbi:hypothetical protein PHET_09293 [Paragonimus heterotremus]|uniref:Uncharacterized protein n=1 Tax=Paragonimus heterotremus TaxID=100268 RepID=A0A8J4T982_9TREM|nr:hypothetical protein PHET_09293 [Paragonimus heterotremus]
MNWSSRCKTQAHGHASISRADHRAASGSAGFTTISCVTEIQFSSEDLKTRCTFHPHKNLLEVRVISWSGNGNVETPHTLEDGGLQAGINNGTTGSQTAFSSSAADEPTKRRWRRGVVSGVNTEEDAT